MMNLASEQNQVLIHIALRGGKARAHWNHGKYNALDKAGLTEVVSKGEIYYTHKLTPAGVKAILDMPDDLECDFFPLPIDIAKAKQVVGKIK